MHIDLLYDTGFFRWFPDFISGYKAGDRFACSSYDRNGDGTVVLYAVCRTIVCHYGNLQTLHHAAGGILNRY